MNVHKNAKRAMVRLAAGQSVRQVAAAPGVAPSSVVKRSQRQPATGSCAPAKIGGRRPRKIVGEHEAWLLARIETPFTLRGLVCELAARGLRVDYRTVWKAVHRAGYSFKEISCPRGAHLYPFQVHTLGGAPPRPHSRETSQKMDAGKLWVPSPAAPGSGTPPGKPRAAGPILAFFPCMGGSCAAVHLRDKYHNRAFAQANAGRGPP